MAAERSSSVPSAGNRPIRSSSSKPLRRIRISYQDDSYRLRALANTKQLIVTATDVTSTGNSAILAKKALNYRRVLERITGVDVQDPSVDISKFLGVDWCKRTNVAPYALRQS